MIAAALHVVSWILLLAGSVFLLVGSIGLLRFPDFYSRLQATSITDSLCTISIMLGLMLQAEALPVAAKLLFTLLFMLFTAPTASLALARAARHGKLDPWQADKEDESSPR
jgi:multicomponent Na+:H+ antiporter subunit G